MTGVRTRLVALLRRSVRELRHAGRAARRCRPRVALVSVARPPAGGPGRGPVQPDLRPPGPPTCGSCSSWPAAPATWSSSGTGTGWTAIALALADPTARRVLSFDSGVAARDRRLPGPGSGLGPRPDHAPRRAGRQRRRPRRRGGSLLYLDSSMNARTPSTSWRPGCRQWRPRRDRGPRRLHPPALRRRPRGRGRDRAEAGSDRGPCSCTGWRWRRRDNSVGSG